MTGALALSGSTQLDLALTTRDGFQVYRKGLTFTYREPGFALGDREFDVAADPPATEIYDAQYQEPRKVHGDGTRFRLTLTPGQDLASSGEIRVRVEACSLGRCLLPAILVVAPLPGATSRAAPRQVSPPLAPGLKSAAQAVPSRRESGVSGWFQESYAAKSLLTVPVLFLAGLLVNLTPCIYPMIPITLGVISQFGGGSQRLLPLAYVGGVALTYASAGVAAAMTGTVFGSLLQHTGVSLSLALLMGFLGLSMLGVVDLSRVQTWAASIPLARRIPWLGVATMGAVSGLVAAPCTGPVLSMILLLIGQSKDPVAGFALMLVFSLGFGAPYLVLGALSQRIPRLPKLPGAAEVVKLLFAAAMFGLGLSYLRPLLGAGASAFYARPSAAIILGTLGATLSAHFLARRSVFFRVSRMATLSALALWGTLAATGQFPQDRTLIAWEHSLERAKAQAAREGKGLLVDAWASWCAACLAMDRTVWQDPLVIGAIRSGFVAVKVDFTNASEESEALAGQWNLLGLPAVGVYPPGTPVEGPPPTLFREAVDAYSLLSAIRPGRAPQ